MTPPPSNGDENKDDIDPKEWLIMVKGNGMNPSTALANQGHR